jgi:hypothetical protein
VAASVDRAARAVHQVLAQLTQDDTENETEGRDTEGAVPQSGKEPNR